MEGNKKRKSTHPIMTTNVTQFRHLIKNPHANQNDVTWVINLRSYDQSPSKISKSAIAPQVYHKKTKTVEIRQEQFLKSKIKKFAPFKCSQFSHMLPQQNQKTIKQSESAIRFYSSLREYELGQNKQNKYNFWTIPFKQRHETPKILKKAQIKKLRNLNKEDYETTEDGRQNYPQYSENILRTKNYGLLKSFTSVRGRSQISLPGLAWQVGLRNY